MIHFAVVAHVARTEQAKRLADDLGAELFMDDGSLGEWENHRRALEWGAEQDGHLCVLQDDALPITDFQAHAERAVAERPSDMIGLYVGTWQPYAERVRRAVRRADDIGASWITHKSLLWGVGTIIPTAALPAMLSIQRRYVAQYDMRLRSMWRDTQGRPVHYTWPSLVDHADGPSVIPGRVRTAPRVAHRVGVPNWSDVSVAL